MDTALGEERVRCPEPSVVTVSWINQTGEEVEDYAPMLEVWASGGQLHVDQKIAPGTTVRVRMENGARVSGEVQVCEPEPTFGYTIDLRIFPKHIWVAGPHMRFLSHPHGTGLPKAS